MNIFKGNNWVVFVFVLLLSLNLGQTYLKVKNTTTSRKVYTLSRQVFPLTNEIRFKDETLPLNGNKEVFIHASLSSDIDIQMDVHAPKDALLYIFFHIQDKANRTAYAFRISALPGVPTSFLKYVHSHVHFQKSSPWRSYKILPQRKRFKVRIVSQRGLHTLFIDSEKILQVYDTSYSSVLSPLHRGALSFAAGMKTLTIDNLRLKSGKWTYADDFSIPAQKSTRKHLIILWLAIFSAAAWAIAFLSRRWTDITIEEKNIYFRHLRIQALFLIPGAFLNTYDTLCFMATFTAIVLFSLRTSVLFVKTNLLFSTPSVPKQHNLSFFSKTLLKTAIVMSILFFFYVFLSTESRIHCRLPGCPKTLLMKKTTLSFEKKPYFYADFLNISNPALSFNIYGKEGLATLIVFNKNEKEDLLSQGIGFPLTDSYAMLLSFHKTLPTLLLRGSKIVQKAPETPFMKNKWNSIQILTSGRNIVFFVNGKKILSYPYRKLFRGGVKILPIYEAPKIKNLHIYELKAEKFPILFRWIDGLFFILRLLVFLFGFIGLSYFLLYSRETTIPFSLFSKRIWVFLAFPILLWSIAEVMQHSSSRINSGSMIILRTMGLFLFVSGFLFLTLCLNAVQKKHPLSLKNKIFIFGFILFFYESLCLTLSPYTDTLRKPWYTFVHDKNHYWYFDPRVRIYNEFFDLNRVRAQNYTYVKGIKKRIALFGSSSAYGQFFHAPSREIFSAQLEEKLVRRGYKVEVLNFAMQGSTTFTGLTFLKGVAPLFKPDIIVWNYAGNDMVFMHGSRANYHFLESLFTQKKFFLYRWLNASYTFQTLANVLNSTWMKSLFYAPRPQAKKALFKENLKALVHFCKKNRIQLILLHESRDDTIWFGYNIKKKKLLDKQDRWFYEVFSSFSKKYHVPYIFTVHELVKHRDDRLYLDTVHYSKAGHDIMANIVEQFMLKKKLLR